MGVEITSPDKALWPASADDPAPVTKLDYARYLEAVADHMLPHVRGRPCSIVRAPDGIGGEVFFQRHAGAGLAGDVGEVRLEGDDEPYIQADDRRALAALAQAAALELHPWNCRPGAPDVPGRLVFDLDPGDGVPFDEVVDAAREVRGRLSQAGLESFCKTTGGKGLHVVAPLAPSAPEPPTWPRAKGFARTLCEAMAADAPARYVTVMARSERTGRIFLDYLRNDRMASAVAPFSARARPGALVAMPLDWTEVRRSLDPSRFTVRTVPSLLDGLTAWDGYDAAERPLPQSARA